MKVFCFIPSVFKGYRDLQPFNNAANKAWSKTGEIFPMYDEISGEIFECGFNAEHCSIVAYNEISVEQFREKLQQAAQDLIQARVQAAIAEASAEAAELYRISECAERLRG